MAEEIQSVDRLKELNKLISAIDAPRNGDRVMFTIHGNTGVYDGVIQVEMLSDSKIKYKISTKIKNLNMNKISSIIVRGKRYNVGENSKIS
jgi:hypothetical protein